MTHLTQVLSEWSMLFIVKQKVLHQFPAILCFPFAWKLVQYFLRDTNSFSLKDVAQLPLETERTVFIVNCERWAVFTIWFLNSRVLTLFFFFSQKKLSYSHASFYTLQQNPGKSQPGGQTLTFFFELTILIYGSIRENRFSP